MKDKMLNKELICFLINIIKSLKQRMNLFEEKNIQLSFGKKDKEIYLLVNTQEKNTQANVKLVNNVMRQPVQMLKNLKYFKLIHFLLISKLKQYIH